MQHECISHSVVSDNATPWTVAASRLLCPWNYPGKEYWSGLPCPSPGDLSNPGLEPPSPAWQEDYLLSEPPGKPLKYGEYSQCIVVTINGK